MSRLFESIKIVNGNVMFPEYHQLRIDNVFDSYFNKNKHNVRVNKISVPEKFKQGIVKCRLIYDDKTYFTEFEFYKKRNINKLKLVCDDAIEYNYKFKDRKDIEKCLLQKGNCDEVIIVKNSYLTDTSFTNLIFWNGCEWHTPSTYLLNGTCRQRLLDSGFISEAEINIYNYTKYQGFKLINAMLYPDDTEIIPIENIMRSD